jgi:hypothetical protein
MALVVSNLDPFFLIFIVSRPQSQCRHEGQRKQNPA